MGAGRVPASVAGPEGVAFEVERFEWTNDGRLELMGRWYGLRGHRFVRPALMVDAGDDRRRILADLEHKPWAAEDGEEWIAAFPWEGEPVALAGAELAVAPTLAVELPAPRHPGRRRKAGPPPTPGPRPESAERATVRHLEAELAEARATIRRLTAEVDDAREQQAAEAERAPESQLDHEAVRSERDEAVRSGAAAMQERDEALDARATANWERDAARAERDAAKVQHDRAAHELQAALERCEQAERERDAAVAQRDRAVDARAALVREREAATAAPDPAAPAVRRAAISREAMRQESALVLWATRFAALVVLIALAAAVYALVHSAV
jgi:hypothetical protein